MCDTQSRARKGTCEGGVPTEGAASRGCAASSSRASPACRPQPKHPYGRRNTYISSYTRHGLGFATADRDESLTTTKFRDLPLRERRLYTLTLGYGLRDDDKGGVAGADRCQRQSQMSRGRAVALMARLHEMLLHGGRTVEGIFSALGVDTSHVHEGQCKEALEHMSVRAGTAIPTGSAERTLASLYQQRVEAWPFLAERLPASEVGCEAEAGRLEEAEQERSATIKPEDSTNEGGRGEKTDDQQEQQPAQSREGHGTDAKKKGSVSTSDKTACKSFSLTRLSAALEAFTRTRADRGCQLDDFRAQDLADFLYLGGQAKITLKELQDIVEKYGRWAVERARREAKELAARHTEATRNAASGKAFALTDEQLNAAVDFLDPNQDGNIDLEELMRAFKQDRTAKAILKKDDDRQKMRLKGRSGGDAEAGSSNGAEAGSINNTNNLNSDDDGDDHEGGDVDSLGRGERGASGAEGQASEVNPTMQGAHRQEEKREDHKEERSLFLPQEAEALTAFLVERQKAFSLINVADIQHGLRAAKRAEAQVASRNVYRRAAERFAAELRGAGMVLESDDGWKRWFDTCDLGLRAGAAGTKRLVGRNELRRGLKALSAAPRVPPKRGRTDGGNKIADSGEGEEGQRGRDVAQEDFTGTLPMAWERGPWREQDVDDLLNAVAILGGGGATVEGGDADAGSGVGGNESGKDNANDLTDVEFRERLMVAIDEGGTSTDRDMAEAQRILPLAERLLSYLKDNGMRLGQLFEQMVAWAKNASQAELMQRTPDRGGMEDSPPLASPRAGTSATGAAGSGVVCRGDDSCVSPVALRAVLTSLRTGGLTAADRARLKADKNSALKEEEDLKAAEGMSAEAAKRIVEADKSGASVVLALLRASVASKSIRVVELFNAMDTSKDGLISREELKEGLLVIAEGAAGKSSMEQLREDCRKRKLSAAVRDKDEKEMRRAIKLRARIAAAEGSGAAKVLRRIHEHLVQTGHKVVDMFHSFSLRGNLTLTTAELEMALSLVDGLEVTRREVRSVVQFLDKDKSGTIDVAEVDEAIRDFRELSRDLPSLGTGPLTVLDAAEIDRLARRTFADIADRRDTSCVEGNNQKDGASSCVKVDNENDAGDDNETNRSRPYTTSRAGGADDVQFRPPETAVDTATTTAAAVVDEGPRETEGAEGDGHEVDRNEGGGKSRTISIADIAEEFREAFRQFKDGGEGKHSIGAMRHPGTQQPSTDTQHAQACVDKVMGWLRSSRTFDRAPTGRVPALAEQMTERQKMELELQSKLQEKRRRAAGQRHWEEWVSRKARHCKSGSGNDNNDDDNDEESAAIAREAQEEERRKRDQDEAFAAWAREKDRILRAAKREKRRAMTAGGLNTLEAINKKLRGARCSTPSRLPHLRRRSNGGSVTSGGPALDGGGHGCEGSMSTGGTSKGVHCSSGNRSRAPMMKKAELKALDLAVTRVAVSPYRVRAKEKYQHSKHIEGGNIVTRMARNRSKPFPKALVEEGWQATSLLLGSASMSLIDHPTARHAAAVARGSCGSDNRSKRNDQDHTGDAFVNDSTTPTDRRSSTGGRKGRRRRRRIRMRIARNDCAERRDSARNPDDPGEVTPPVSDTPLGSGAVGGEVGHASAVAAGRSGSGSGTSNSSSVVSFVVPRSSSSEGGDDAASAPDRPSSSSKDQDKNSSVEHPEDPRTGTSGEEDRGRNGDTEGGGDADDTLHGDAAAAATVAAVGARPDGRRGNSRGAPEGTGHADGLDGTAKAGGVGGGGGSRRGSSNSEDMDFPIQSQALPDWADTIKGLPVDDPYEEGEDDFEPDDQSASPAK